MGHRHAVQGFFFAQGLHTHQGLHRILRERHPRLFEGSGSSSDAERHSAAIAARAKVRFWGIAEVLQKKADDINLQAFLVCGEVPSEVDRLMRTSAENYYQVLSTFVHLSDLRTPREEQPEADDHG